MTFLYRVQVQLIDGEIRTWYEQGNSADEVKGRTARTLYNCKVDTAWITVKPDDLAS